MVNQLRAFVPLLLLSTVFLECAHSSPVLQKAVTLGDPLHPEGLANAISDAHKAGANDITINPGTYSIPLNAAGQDLVFRNWQDVTIHATGVTIVFMSRKDDPLYLGGCKNLTWDGGTLEYAHPAATQGRITAIGSDAKGQTCDWQVDAGYTADVNPRGSAFDVVDASTRLLKPGTGDWNPASYEKLQTPGAFRFHYWDKPGFAVNDWLITRASGGNKMAHLDGCENCTLENVTFCNCGFASMFETGGGGNHFLRCKIQTGPRPAGATEDEIVSSGADEFHSVGTSIGPDIEDCSFTGVAHDDCIAIHGSFGRVLSAEGKTVVLKGGGGDPVVGEPLRFSDTHGFFGQAQVTAIEKMPDGNTTITLDQDLQIPIDHSQDKDQALGTKANNPNRCGRGFKILRCRLGDTRSRGILVKADDGLISGCVIEGCGMTGVSIGPEFWWGEANYCWNITVSHNTFRNCSKNNGDQGTVWVHFDGAMGNRNILIADNLIDTCYGQNIFRIEGANGVAISGNQIKNAFTLKSGKPGDILWLNHSRNVTLSGNEVDHQGLYAGPIVRLDPSVPTSEVHQMDTGIVLK